MAATLYDDAFFSSHDQGCRASARQAIPIVLEFTRPASIVDVGCGTGTWLAGFRAAGIADVVGVDGDYVDRDKLSIDRKTFLARDLEQPLDLGRRFDMAMSLEVAEHLPDRAADTFVASLVRLAPLILFSAAIPWQGGTNHCNEQWPDYWHAKFTAHDYVAVDCLRERLWQNAEIEAWYAQNMLFYVHRDRLADYPALAEHVARRGTCPPLALVHPRHYLGLYEFQQKTIRDLWKRLDLVYRTMVSESLKLRTINLLVFPDWKLPPATLSAQLRELCAVVWSHPSAGSMTLVATLPDARAQDLLQRAAQEGGVAARSSTPGPVISGVPPEFSVWPVLLRLAQARVVLANNDEESITKFGAGALPTITVATIGAKQPLVQT